MWVTVTETHCYFLGKQVRFPYPPTLTGGYNYTRGVKKVVEKKNKIIYDWLSFTSQIHEKEDIVMDLLGMGGVSWLTKNGAHGYRQKLYFDCCSVHFDGREDMGVWCDLSGQGCRNFETFGTGDYENIFRQIEYNSGQMNLTRLDVAYDDFEGLLDIDVLVQDVLARNYVAPSDKFMVQLSSEGTSITVGSQKSEFYIRIYDKARERGYTDGTHWVRLEMQMRRDRAKKFAFLPGDIGAKFFGVLNNYVRFVTPNENNSRKSCWETAPYWSAFLQSMERISIYEKPGTEYNEYQLENFVFKQAGNSVYTYIKCFGEEEFFKKLYSRGTVLNPKHEMLISKYNGDKNDIKIDDTGIFNGAEVQTEQL